MSEKYSSANHAGSGLNSSRKKLLSKLVNVGLFAALGGGTAIAAPAGSYSLSRVTTKTAIIYKAERADAEKIAGNHEIFSSFGKKFNKKTIAQSEPNAETLEFLERNGLLKASAEVAANISGETFGRKAFSHEAAADHCHLYGNAYYASSWTGLDEAQCNMYSGEWYAASSKPFVNNTVVKNKTTTSFQVDVTASKASTIYAVLLNTSAVAPSSVQVIAGTDGSGNAAIQARSLMAANTGTFSFSGLNSNANYIVYLVAQDSTPEVTPIPVTVNPAFETGLIDDVPYWKFPKIRTNSAGDFYVGQASNGVIRFRKWNGAGFNEYASITAASVNAHGVGWGNEQRVDYEVDSAGRIYAVFSVYETQWAVSGDPYFGYFNGTNWTFSKIAETGDGVDNVDVFVDLNGNVHSSFMTRGTGNVVYYATNKSGSWVISTIASALGGMDEIHDTYVVADASGNATVIYRREDDQNNAHDNYYIAYSSNNFANPSILKNGKVDQKQYNLAGLAIDSSNKLHYAYANISDGTSYYVTNASGFWVETSVSKGAHSNITVSGFERVEGVNYFASYSGTNYFMSSYDGEIWVDGFDFKLDGYMNDRFAINTFANRVMVVSENSVGWTISYHSGAIAGYLTPPMSNNSPTDISLSNNSVNQRAGINAEVGTLTSTDADSGSAFTYSLVSGSGDTHNASFNIAGSSLRANNAASLPAGNYSVRVRTTDNAGGSFEKPFTITVSDDVAPTINISSSVTSLKAGATAAVIFTLSEATTDFTADDVSVTGGELTGFSGSGTSYTATFIPATNTTATATIDVAAGAFADAAMNLNIAATQLQIAVNTVAPTVSSISRVSSALSNATSVNFTVTFSEGVTGVDAWDFVLTRSGSVDGTVTNVAQGATGTYTVTVNDIWGDGTLRLDVKNSGTGISNAAGNGMAGGYTGGEVYTFDHTAPAVIEVSVPASADYTTGQTLDFTLHTSEDVTVDTAGGTPRIALTIGGVTRYATYVSGSNSSALHFRYTLSASDADGLTVGSAIDANGGTLRDAATNSMSLTLNSVGSTSGVLINPKPTVTDANISISGASGIGGAYKIGDTVTATWNNTAQGDNNAGVTGVTADFTEFGGDSAVVAIQSSGFWTATYTLTAGSIDATDRNVSITVTNAQGSIAVTDNTNAIVDIVPPGVTGVAPAAGALPADARVEFTVNFSESVSNISADDFTVGATGAMAEGIASVSASSGTSVTVTVSGISGEGTIKLNVNGSTNIVDDVGNIIAGFTSGVGHTVDREAPAVPSVPVLTAGSDSGTAGDNITNITTPTFTGTAEAGSVIKLYDGATVLGTTTATGGVWTISSSSLSEGSHGITATATDAVGNESVPSTPLGVTIDTTLPTVSSVTFDQTGVTAANSAAISLSLAGAEVGTKASYTIISTGGGTTAGASGVNISSATQQIAGIDVSGLNDGTLTVNLRLEDLAGNISSAVTNTINKDTSAPEVASVAISSGNYALGNVVSVTVTLSDDVTISGTHSTVAIDIGGTTRQAAFVSENAGTLLYQYTVQADDNTDAVGVIALANGLSLNGDTIADDGGNAAGLAYAQVSNTDTQIDTIVPEDPVVVSPAAAVSVNADDYTITGTHSEDGVTVSLYVDGDNNGIPDNTLVLDSIVVTNGAWSLLAPLVGDAANQFVVIAEDAAGNTSTSVGVPTVTEDSTAPTAPSTPELTAASDTGISDSDGITRNTTPILTGTAEADSTITLTSDKDGEIGSGVADGSGSWSITTTTLAGGTHHVTATATDAAGNTSTLSTAIELTIDDQAPTLSTVADQSLNPGAAVSDVAITVGDDISLPANLTLTATSANVAVVPSGNLVLGGNGANRSVSATALGSGSTTITLTVEDEAGNTATTTFTVAVNSAPAISGVPATSVDQDTAYSFMPVATDVDSGTELVFGITNQPAWASFDSATGAITGTPTNADVGTTSGILISVSDGALTASLPPFNVTVVNINDAPIISGTPLTMVLQDAPYRFTATADDIDGDALTFSITGMPTWASFDPQTGTLSGTPTRDHVGDHTGIIISVSDGVLSASLPAFAVHVEFTNAAPVIGGTPPPTAFVGAAYRYTPIASDPDGDVLTFSAVGLPAWLSLDPATGTLTGTPVAARAGESYSIVLSVSDGVETATLPVFSLSVDYDGNEPVVSAPADITKDATGLYTPVNLRQLLGLPAGTSSAVVEDALAGLASDSTGGASCCITRPQGLLDNQILLAPGRHEIIWRATNGAGLTGEAVQVVNVRPRVSFNKHQVALKGTSTQVRIILNGPSPFYPLEIPYVVDPASTATLADHDLRDGSVIFTAGQTEATLTVNLHSGLTPDDTRLILALDDRSPHSSEPLPGFDADSPDLYDINSGAANTHVISIVEGNIAPRANLILTQNGRNTILVGANDGPVIATAVVADPNPGDTHSFNWSTSDDRLTDTDGSATDNTFVFNPAGHSGLRHLEVVTTDSAGATDTTHLHFLVLPSLPVLDGALDTDDDGIDDLTEGTFDSNNNGIPDYLDNMPASNVLPQVIISTSSYLIECDPGVLCGVGQSALKGNSGGVQILEDELLAQAELIADENFKPVGGIFDFVVRDLPTPGESVRVVIPQQAPIPAHAVYRKYRDGQWRNFVEDDRNHVHSVPGIPGYCPPPGEDSWTPGLVEGYLCVQLSIEDGGPNDADGLVNSAVADPGAVSSAKPAEPLPPPPAPPAPSISIESKGGGALDWTWILFGGVLLVLRRYGSKKPAVLLLVMALFSGASQAQPEVGETYLRLNVYQAEGNQSADDFRSAMAGDGMAVSLRDYDVSRVAYRLSVGYQWSEATSVELGYLDLGNVTVNFDTTVTDMAALTRALEEHYPTSADGFTLSHRVGHHFTSGVSLSGEVGIFMWDGKIGVAGAAIDPDLGSGIDPLLGVQLDYRLAEPVSLGLGYQRIFFDGQAVDLMGVSGIWHF